MDSTATVDTISVLNPNDTLNNIDFTGVKFTSFEAFSSFLLKTFESNNIKVYKDSDKIEVLEELGKGAFGIVHKAQMNDEIIAIKFLDKIDHTIDPEKTIISIINELKAMTKVDHEKIPKFHGVYQKDENLGLIFSFIQGVTLNVHIDPEKNPNITNEEKLDLIIQLTEILEALHQKRVIHRDIKPKNTMVTPEKKLILIDFGISRINEKTVANTNGLRGSPAYSPPEAFKDVGDGEDREYRVTTKFDVWSIGCVIYEMFSGEKPWQRKFKDSNRILLSLSKAVDNGSYGIPVAKKFETDFPELADILKHCVAVNIDNRYTSKQLLEKLKGLQK